jgi:hypothetical protein
MSELFVALLSLVIGVAATLFVGHYYFRRTVDKALTPFLHFSTSLFRGIAPEVRQALRIEYRGVPVEELLEMQFLVANTGERAIHDVIEPLTVTLPEGCSLLDASLLHVSPAERQITLSKEERAVRFTFPLLNRQEFFLVRLLLRGDASPRNLVFSITADDLPPRLPVTPIPPELIGTSEKQDFEWGALVASVLIALFATAVASVVYQVWTHAVFSRAGFWSFIPEWSWPVIAACVAAIPAILLVVLAVAIFFASFSGGSFPPKRRLFVVPRDFVRHQYPFLYLDERHVADTIPKLPDKA